MAGTFIVVDGIDGSGKSTITASLADALVKRGKRVFDLIQFQKQHRVNPSIVTLAGYDVILSGEPSYCWIGAAIRNTIIRSNSPFPGSSVAQAFALDREVHYREVLLPALAAGVTVIQDRGVSTTLCYQPIQDMPVPVESILALEGNRLALEHRPDTLILANCRVPEAIRRITTRSGKKDDSVFERGDFLTRASQRFASADFRSLFTNRGTRVIDLDTNVSQDEVRAAVDKLIPTLISV